MTASKLPHQIARERLAKRAREQVALANGVTPKSMLKTPSQRKSEAGRKRLLKKAGIKTEKQLVKDCTGCPKDPCGKKILACDAPSTRYQCKQCGVAVICYRTEPRPDYCPPCRERKCQ